MVTTPICSSEYSQPLFPKYTFPFSPDLRIAIRCPTCLAAAISFLLIFSALSPTRLPTPIPFERLPKPPSPHVSALLPFDRSALRTSRDPVATLAAAQFTLLPSTLFLRLFFAMLPNLSRSTKSLVLVLGEIWVISSRCLSG